MDAVLERLERLERLVEEGIPAMPAGGYVPAQNAGIAGDPMMGDRCRISPQMYAQHCLYDTVPEHREMARDRQVSQRRIRREVQNPPASGQTYRAEDCITAESPAGGSQHDPE